MNGIYHSIFLIGTRGLVASQQALTVTSQNIANSNTPFYSRREVEFTEAFYNVFGNGVNVSDAYRVIDDAANKHLQKMTSDLGMSSSYAAHTKDLESLFDMGRSGIGRAMNESINALNAINANPSSMQTREQYLYQIGNMVSSFNRLDNQLEIEQQNVNHVLNTNVGTANNALEKLALLNEKILTANPDERLEILDARDALMSTLSNTIGVESSTDSRGVLNVSLANGTSLLLGTTPYLLTTVPAPGNSSQVDVVLAKNPNTIITSLITSGDMAGQLSYQNNVLVVAKSELEQLALNFSQSMNTQNKLGMDLDGNLGGDLITYTLNPDNTGAINLNLTITNPRLLALAFPVATASGSANQGSGKITVEAILDTTTSAFSVPNQLNPPIQIQFVSANSYNIINANDNSVIESNIAYNANLGADLFPTPGGFDPGYRVCLSDDNQAGDVFTINYNINGTGDNRNGLVLADIQQTWPGAFQSIKSVIALQANSASQSFDSSDILKKQAEARRDQVSGVSLQEETINLTRYQQAYQASAQIIDVGQKIFDTLIAISRS